LLADSCFSLVELLLTCLEELHFYKTWSDSAIHSDEFSI